ncbi:MAG: O-antigen ligase family protein [Gammaproteobacteria bacterium]|nr:O-antigen ligase family protein [Gammaproteobacteria bacterium]
MSDATLSELRPPAPWSARIPAALIAACLLVLPFGRVVEGPVALMAIAGLYLLASERRALLSRPAVRLFGAVFLAAWAPMVISLMDAVNPEHTGITVLNHLRFYLGGLFVLHVLARADDHRWLLRVCAWVLAVWVVDALVQIAFGRDLLGYAASGGRINALFGDRNPAFSLTLAALCPLLWEHARRHWPAWLAALTVIATVAVVLVAETRSAWINVAVILAAYAVLLAPRARLGTARLLAVLAVALLVGGAALYHLSDRFAGRIEQTTAALSGQIDTGADAIGHRLWIWKGALDMIGDHPVNGVGARGFRYAFAEHAAADDPYINRDTPVVPTHSHQLWLETLAETGIIGLAGLVLLLWLLARAAWRADPPTRSVMLPYGLCLLAAYFPFNTHMAIYSSFWSQIVWWLIALYCAASGVADAPRSAEGERR